MPKEKFDQHQEEDPTSEQRMALVDELQFLAIDESDKKILEKFRKGFFFVPSETTRRVSELINLITDPQKKGDLQRSYGDILRQA